MKNKVVGSANVGMDLSKIEFRSIFRSKFKRNKKKALKEALKEASSY